MRTQDELLRAFRVSPPPAQRYIVRQLERLPITFDSEEHIELLELERGRASEDVKDQIALALSSLLPRWHREQGAGASQDSRSKPSLWTLHQIRVEDLAREIAAANDGREPAPEVPLETVYRAALHLLAPALECLYRAPAAENQLKREEAVLTLGRIPSGRAVALLAESSVQPGVASLAAISLARLESRQADQPLLAASRGVGDMAPVAGVLLGLRDRPSAEATQVLARAASSKTAAVRLGAAVALENSPASEALGLLERLASDADEWVRVHALDTVGRLRKAEATTLVASAYKKTQHPFLRMVALKAAGALASEGAVGLCMEALKGTNPDVVKAVAIEGLVRLGAPKERFREFVGLLAGGESAKLASNLILALAGTERDAVNRSLKAMLASTSELHRAEAAYCLGYLDDPAALKLLAKLIDKDKSDIVRGQALHGIFHHRSVREGRDALLSMLRHETAEVRLQVSRMLRAREYANDPMTAERAREALGRERDPQITGCLLRVVASSAAGAAEAREALLEALDSQEPAALSGALEGLAALGDAGLAGHVAALVRQDDARVRAHAARTLFLLGDPRGAAALAALLAEPYFETFQCGARALGRIVCDLAGMERKDAQRPVLEMLRKHAAGGDFATWLKADGAAVFLPQPTVAARAEDFDHAPVRGQLLFRESTREGEAMLERLDRMFDSGEAGMPSLSSRSFEFKTFTLMQTDGIGDSSPGAIVDADKANIRALYKQAVAGDLDAERKLREMTRHGDPKVRDAASKLLVRVAEDRTVPAGSVAALVPEEPFALSLEDLLKEAVRLEASDVHLSVGYPPIFRVHGAMERTRHPALTAPNTRWLARQLVTPEKWASFESQKDLDFSFSLAAIGSFRGNVFQEFHGTGIVLRVVPSKIPTFDELGAPPLLRTICREERGLILVTGPTGSGKSTTMAAMLAYINENRSCHIVTIEDPIEFVHRSINSKFIQREVPTHAASFARALRAALREDPDVIMVGELRDLETMELAIAAAETGHLVLSTLHTINAALTVDRVINVFPPEQQEQVRRSVSEALLAVVSQALLPRQDRPGRIAAFECLFRNPAISNMIRENKLHQIPNVMVSCKKEGMVLLDDFLFDLVVKGVISWETAQARAVMKKEFAERFAARKVTRS
ncbi:MAG: PilT/PilU family type 4a pilus ATPase [Candidatus Wallbacteria bacterium]|nr:PilT/PilU family type 4a pilus ATPase [Candidatus Wallbacteria bacterium]